MMDAVDVLNKVIAGKDAEIRTLDAHVRQLRDNAQVRMDEIDRLRKENDTLRHLVARQPIDEGRYDDALHAELAALRQWQQEAAAVIVDLGGCTDGTCQCAVVDLLRSAGVEVEG